MIVIDPDGSDLPEQLGEERANNLIFAACSAVALAGPAAFLGWAVGGFVLGVVFGCFASFIIDKLGMAWWSYYLAILLLSSRRIFPFSTWLSSWTTQRVRPAARGGRHLASSRTRLQDHLSG